MCAPMWSTLRTRRAPWMRAALAVLSAGILILFLHVSDCGNEALTQPVDATVSVESSGTQAGVPGQLPAQCDHFECDTLSIASPGLAHLDDVWALLGIAWLTLTLPVLLFLGLRLYRVLLCRSRTRPPLLLSGRSLLTSVCVCRT